MLRGAIAAAVLLAGAASAARAQRPAGETGSVTAHVIRADSTSIEGAFLRSGSAASQTNAGGVASLRLSAGRHDVVVGRIGFTPETLSVTIRANVDTALTVVLAEQSAALEGVLVSATRSERRIEDEPLRVEVLGPEEVEEKLLMTPGDISMMLNETSGLRVQTTSPSLGGANVRVQGLRGRYTQVLSDGLPLHGGQTGGLGLLQIPPMDLGGVEVIKGAASALYGASALGGVINLTSRRPGREAIRELLANQTTLGGTDLVAFLAGRNDGPVSYTALVGGHRQRQVDRDHDGWTDLPGYERVVLRPRVFVSSERGHNAMLTAGFTGEDRDGGTVAGAVAPDGQPYLERLRTARLDAGGVARMLVGPAGVLSARGSVSGQRHRHTFGETVERDTHLTAFGEVAYTVTRGSAVGVLGAAIQQERYRARDVPGFDYTFTTPGIFAQGTFEPAAWAAVTASARTDRHDEYGSFVSPRLSLLLRRPASPWTLRLSLGGGFFAPTPFTEETEVIGLLPLRPLRASDLAAERARSGSLDVGGALGPVEVNATLFGSSIHHPVALRAVVDDGVALVNVEQPTRTAGAELLARWNAEPFHLTATYTFVRSRESDPETGLRRSVPLTPRQQAGVVGSWEVEGVSRVGVEVYFTGRQTLDEDAYRGESRSYVHVGLLAERRIGAARVFVNAENLLDVRQTRYDPLVRPTRGLGGRWTNDVWAPLDGRVANVGVRYELP